MTDLFKPSPTRPNPAWRWWKFWEPKVVADSPYFILDGCKIPIPTMKEYNRPLSVHDTVDKITTIDWDQPGSIVFEQLRLWGEQTFGPGTAASLFKRAMKEMKELEAEVEHGWTEKAVEEAVDVLFIFTRAPGLWEAMERKMAINLKRKWQLAGDGTGSHVRDQE